MLVQVFEDRALTAGQGRRGAHSQRAQAGLLSRRPGLPGSAGLGALCAIRLLPALGAHRRRDRRLAGSWQAPRQGPSLGSPTHRVVWRHRSLDQHGVRRRARGGVEVARNLSGRVEGWRNKDWSGRARAEVGGSEVMGQRGTAGGAGISALLGNTKQRRAHPGKGGGMRHARALPGRCQHGGAGMPEAVESEPRLPPSPAWGCLPRQQSSPGP